MKQEIFLMPTAVKALVNSVWTGPNCSTQGDFILVNNLGKGAVSLASIRKYFDDGPDTFLIAYAVANRKYRLASLDIARAYCLDHINMVRAADQIFRDEGDCAHYFEKLHERGFSIWQSTLSSYLYSCVGKAGKVVEMVDGLATVETNHCYLRGVVTPEGLGIEKGSIVVVHFATAVLTLSVKEAEQVSIEQDRNPWFHALSVSLPGDIDYSDFCRNNLSNYARERLKMLR